MSRAGNGTKRIRDERTKSTEASGQEGDGAAGTQGGQYSHGRGVGPAHEGPWRLDSKSHIKPLEGSNRQEDVIRSAFLKFPPGDSLAVQGLGLHVLTARSPGSIPGQGTT